MHAALHCTLLGRPIESAPCLQLGGLPTCHAALPLPPSPVTPAAALAGEKDGGKGLRQLVELAGGSVATEGKAKKAGGGPGQRLAALLPGPSSGGALALL